MITHAYEVLFDEQTRRRYDHSRLVAPFLLTKRSVRRRRKRQNIASNSGNRSTSKAQSHRVRTKRKRARPTQRRDRENLNGQSRKLPKFSLDGLSRDAYESYMRNVSENQKYFQRKMRQVEENHQRAMEKISRNLGDGKGKFPQSRVPRCTRKRPVSRSSCICKVNPRNCHSSRANHICICSVYSHSASHDCKASKHPCICSMHNPKASIHCKSSNHECICSMQNPRASIYCKSSRHTCVCSMFINPGSSVHCKSLIHSCICTKHYPNSRGLCKNCSAHLPM